MEVTYPMPDTTPIDRLLKRPEVEERTGFSTTTLYRLMKRKAFPVPVRIGPRAVRWRARDVEAYIESRPLATELPPA